MYKLQFVLLLATSFCFSQNTVIPDANFEQALIDLGYDSGEIDGQVLTANISDVTSLIVNSKNIESLTGIEDFTALTLLWCFNNQITSLDLSANTALNTLYCYTNQLTSLDLSANTALEYLTCFDNQLTSLDIRNENNESIQTFWAYSNPDLSCIFVHDISYSSANWTDIDPTATFVEDETACSALYTSIPDANFEQALIDYNLDSEIDGQVLTANINGITSIDLGGFNISDLTGIEGFTALDYLRCEYNQLTSLDVSQNTALEYLECNNNGLTSLDVSSNANLITLICNSNELTELIVSSNTALEILASYDNQLTELIVSSNPALEILTCNSNNLTTLDLSSNINLEILSVDNNQLETLDIRNENNASITYFIATNNPNLSCIFVDNPDYSSTNWTNIDPTATFVEDETACSALYTSIPDANFEQALIDLGYDSGEIDGQVLTANISDVTRLDVGYKSILDLTGIEAFTALEFFTCSNNQLESLDMSANKALIELLCNDNKLTSLDMSANTALTKLWCYDNQLTALDITKNFKLNNLACYLNQLTALDISANTALTSLWCWGNELTSLNLTNNLDLDRLLCESNKLESLDVSSNTNLTRLYCESNQLTSLDLRLNKNLTSLGLANNQLETLDIRNGNNAIISYFISTNNPNLSCIFVDNPSETNDSWQIDPDTFLVKDETACQVLSLGDHAFESEFSVYPSPVKDKLFISGNETPMAVSIFNVLGKEVLSIKNTNNINVEALPSGVYMIRVSYGVSKTNRKFIKY